VNEGVVKPLPLDTFIQATEEVAVVVSDANCQLTLLVVAVGVSIVVIEKLLVNPAVVVSLIGCAEILVIVKLTSLVAEAYEDVAAAVALTAHVPGRMKASTAVFVSTLQPVVPEFVTW
jgi:hypothetical protein